LWRESWLFGDVVRRLSALEEYQYWYTEGLSSDMHMNIFWHSWGALTRELVLKYSINDVLSRGAKTDVISKRMFERCFKGLL